MHLHGAKLLVDFMALEKHVEYHKCTTHMQPPAYACTHRSFRIKVPAITYELNTESLAPLTARALDTSIGTDSETETDAMGVGSRVQCKLTEIDVELVHDGKSRKHDGNSELQPVRATSTVPIQLTIMCITGLSNKPLPCGSGLLSPLIDPDEATQGSGGRQVKLRATIEGNFITQVLHSHL